MYFFSAVLSFKNNLGRWQKSSFKIIKIHNMVHYAPSIRRSGAPIEYSSNLYEHLHIAIMKIPYRVSNKREYIEYIVKYNRRLEALRRATARREEFLPSIGKNTALDMVSFFHTFRE